MGTQGRYSVDWPTRKPLHEVPHIITDEYMISPLRQDLFATLHPSAFSLSSAAIDDESSPCYSPKGTWIRSVRLEARSAPKSGRRGEMRGRETSNPRHTTRLRISYLQSSVISPTGRRRQARCCAVMKSRCSWERRAKPCSYVSVHDDYNSGSGARG